MKIRCATTVLITAWVGSLWTVCALVAPTLFAAIEDRSAAGRIAAVFFRRESWLGLALGAVTTLLYRFDRGAALRPRGYVLLAATALLPVASEILLSPLMQRAREAGDMARFGTLHGIAGGFFLLACLSGVGVVLESNRPRF